MDSPDHLLNYYQFALDSNKAWSKCTRNQYPTLFEKTKDSQSPKILWIGCADSRVPETTILGLKPGEVFVHRNIANIVAPSDINTMAVIEYAVTKLCVHDIILCGHTRCGGAEAALSDNRCGGVIDHWITPLRTLRRNNAEILDGITDKVQRGIKLSELGVKMSVQNLLNNYSVRDAMKVRGLRVHGCIYDVATGMIRDLNIETNISNNLPSKESQIASMEL